MDVLQPDMAQTKGKVIDPTFIYIKSAVNKNLLRVRDRVWSSAKFVPHEHLLAKILLSLGLRNGMLFDELRYEMTDRMYQLSNTLGITSATNYGHGHQDVLLQGDLEIILFTAEPFTPSKDWQNLQPIKFLYHEHTNLNCQLGVPDSGDAVAYLTINLPMLAYQYLEWAKWAALNGVTETTYSFIRKYPMFNSLYSYIDISLFNRHYYRLSGTPIPDDLPYREIPLVSVEHLLQKSNLYILDLLLKQHRTVAQSLYFTPTVWSEHSLALTIKPRVVKTRQSQWVLDYFRLPYIHYGILVSGESGHQLDTGVLSTLRRELTAIANIQSIQRLPGQSSQHIIGKHFTPLLELLQSS